MSKLITKRELSTFLKANSEWKADASGKKLSQVRSFSTHVDALVFIARVTVHAQVLDHHPDITFTHKKVKLVLSTHEVKGITKKDIELAKRISTVRGG